jgi:hypothetical protein
MRHGSLSFGTVKDILFPLIVDRTRGGFVKSSASAVGAPALFAIQAIAAGTAVCFASSLALMETIDG